MTDRHIRFATDLITFYNPEWWGNFDSDASMTEVMSQDGMTPERFWQRIFAACRDAGLDGVELTFPPGDYRGALQAFGSVDGFMSELASYDLAIASGYFSNRTADDRVLDFENPDHHAELEASIAEYAAFLAACGSDLMVASLQLRHNRTAIPPAFVDITLASQAAHGLHRAGAAALRQGVRLTLHPEAFTVFRTSRDVDLFMTLLDPTFVNLCVDTAQFTVAGGDPIAITQRHKDRLLLTHWKDATGAAPLDIAIDETIWDRQIEWFAPVGRGVVDWPAWMRLLRDVHYQGWAVFELDKTPDPVGELRSIRAYIDATLGHIYR